ncbi:hypothetical protein BD779DRAFT_1534525 [Infundibulicybe gibba]|nr:hypothetical protein BD779DRAFT_1534525 [Infundibulicybe gibba]
MLQNADFRFEQVGSPSASYIIKEIDNNELVVGLSNQFLKLAAISAADLTQQWNVVCDTCETGISQKKGLVATGCNITSITNNLCVQIGVEARDAMFLAGCDNSDSQNFDFWTAIPW